MTLPALDAPFRDRRKAEFMQASASLAGAPGALLYAQVFKTAVALYP